MSSDDAAQPQHDTDTSTPVRSGFGRRLVELVATWGLAVVVPLLDTLRREPDFWVARNATYFQVAMFLVALLIAVPLLVALVEALIARVSVEAASWVHLGVLWTLIVVLVVPFIDKLTGEGLGAPAVGVLSCVVSLIVIIGYLRVGFIRDYMAFLVVAPVVIAVLFVVSLPDLSSSSADIDTYSAHAQADASVAVVVFDATAVASLSSAPLHLDSAEFPNFARLAAMADWYPLATSVYSHTNLAVPAILSGDYPEVGVSPVYSNYPQNLFTALASTHRIDAIEVTTALCPSNVCAENRSVSDRSWISELASDSAIVFSHVVVPSSARWRLPPINKQWSGFGGAASADVSGAEPGGSEEALALATDGEGRSVSFGAFLDGFARGEQPTVHYGHFELPHGPWAYLPDGRLYGFPDWMGIDTSTDKWVGDNWYVEQGYLRYKWQLKYADGLLGLMLDRIEELDLLDRMLIVVTSDHGNAFLAEFPQRAFTNETAGSIMGVPLFIRAPGQTSGSVNDGNAEVVDILPTIVDILGGKLALPVDGHSWLDSSWDRRTKWFLTDSGRVLEMPIDEYEQHLGEALDQLNLFASDAISVGPRPDLVGVAVDALESVEVPGFIELWHSDAYPDLYYEVKGPPARLPAIIRATGDIGESPAPDTFVVIMNGRIVASTVAYEEDGSRIVIGAIVSPSFLGPGPVEFEIAGVVGVGPSTELIRYVR